LWALAAAQQNGRSPLETFPTGIKVMGVAATLGVGVWHLTGWLVWDSRTPRLQFVAGHTVACIVYAWLYALGFYLPEALTQSPIQTISSLLAQPLWAWNVMMGSWLYLIVAGLSYMVRTRVRLADESAAAAEARAESRQAQLSALRARLNPHFLFNALHSVSALIKVDPAAADEALDRLGSLLRYVLDESDDLVTVRQEYRFTEQYLALERLRLGDRLRLRLQVDDAVLEEIIPALLLQPLVENAVRHGIAPQPNGGELLLVIEQYGDGLRLIVENDAPSHSAPTASGMGLATLRARVAGIYGDRARVTAERRSGGRFIVTVSLPPAPQGASR
jgi:LytS/YehU family sensor histidine kinase